MSSPEGPQGETGAQASGFDATLRDGRTVHVRPMRSSDESEFLQAFDRMGPEARYMRFMRTIREANVERLRAALGALGDGVIGVAATVPASDGYDIVGSAVVVLGDDRTHGEFAISVAADHGRTGLGSLLMKSLIDAAKRRGLREIHGFVLASNRPMLRLAARLGFEIAIEPEDATVRICRLRLTEA